MGLRLRTTMPKDYTQYQMDPQQCEGLAVQNQPDAPQREAVAGAALRGAAVGAAAGAVSGGSGSKAAKNRGGSRCDCGG